MGKRVAFLVANQDFRIDSGLSSLRGPLNDIAALSNILSDRLRGNFEVRTFVNSTSFEIRMAIDEELGNAGKGDLILIHYAGHGKLDKFGNLCLATADTRAAALQATSIPCRHIQEFVENSDCDAVVLILDCCYSGAATNASRGDVESQLVALEDATGFYILSASNAIQTASELEINGIVFGNFTSILLEGLQTGDADNDGDGRISLHDLFRYVAPRIKHQTPRMFSARAGGDPLICLSPISLLRQQQKLLDQISRESKLRDIEKDHERSSLDDILPPPESDFRSFSVEIIQKIPHPEAVVDVAFNRTNTRMATVCDDGKIRVFDIKTFERLKLLQAKPHTLRSASWSRSGQEIATGDSTGLIRLWRDGAQVGQMANAQRGVRYAEYSPDGMRLVAGDEEGFVSLWHPQRRALIWRKRCHSGAINSARFNDSGEFIVTASADGTASVILRSDGSETSKFTGHDGEIASAFFISGGPDNLMSCVSAGLDGQICIWRVQKVCITVFVTKHNFWVRALSYCPQGQFIISGGHDSNIKIIDLRSGNVFEATKVYGGSVICVRSSPDAKIVVVTTDDGNVFILRLLC